MALDVLTAPTLAQTRHGFFTRKGGVSQGIYAGLNCGRGSNDAADHVQQNRALVADHMGVAHDHLISVHQYHSADVVVVNGPLPTLPKADAMVTNTPGVALGILTADCQPVLLADRTAGVVGAAHAGWKGAKAGVLQATVDAMVRLGADASRIAAAIGPCIHQDNYEVGPDFHHAVTHDDPEALALFKPGDGDRHFFDLPAYGLMALRRAGVSGAVALDHCTYGDPGRFFSYRRTCHQKDPDYGRLIACIAL